MGCSPGSNRETGITAFWSHRGITLEEKPRGCQIDIPHFHPKKVGRLGRPNHCAAADRHESMDGAGWEFAHMTVDGHSRVSFVQMHAGERRKSAWRFLLAAVAYQEAGVVTIECLTRTTARPADCSVSPGPARPWASNQPWPDTTVRGPMARPSASSRHAARSGLMGVSGPATPGAFHGSQPS